MGSPRGSPAASTRGHSGPCPLLSKARCLVQACPPLRSPSWASFGTDVPEGRPRAVPGETPPGVGPGSCRSTSQGGLSWRKRETGVLEAEMRRLRPLQCRPRDFGLSGCAEGRGSGWGSGWGSDHCSGFRTENGTEEMLGESPEPGAAPGPHRPGAASSLRLPGEVAPGLRSLTEQPPEGPRGGGTGYAGQSAIFREVAPPQERHLALQGPRSVHGQSPRLPGPQDRAGAGQPSCLCTMVPSLHLWGLCRLMGEVMVLC